jgi:hypothetical protein
MAKRISRSLILLSLLVAAPSLLSIQTTAGQGGPIRSCAVILCGPGFICCDNPGPARCIPAPQCPRQ